MMISLIPRLFPPPVFDRLRYANTKGKAWEICSRAVTSGRQKVDIWGAVPNEESRSHFLYYRSDAGGQSISKAVSIPSVIHSTRDGTKRELLLSGTAPRVSISVYLT